MNGSVTVSFVQQDGDRSALGRPARSAAAEWRCRDYITSHATAEFDVAVSGSLRNPRIEVTFQDALLEQLPLLADVQGSTESNEGVKLPCSPWSVVSLLIVLTGDISVKGWFEGNQENMDEALPADTLEVADYMGCTHVKGQIMEWLGSVVEEVIVSYHDTERDKTIRHPLTDRIASLTKMLLHVPATLFKDSAVKKISDANLLEQGIDSLMMKLPAPLLTRWLEATMPVIDLMWISMAPAQWAAVAVAIAQSPPGALKELTLTLLEENQKDMLQALQAILPKAPCLSYLCLWGVRLSNETLCAFEEMVCMLPPTLQQLDLDFGNTDGYFGSRAAKRRLFSAVAQIRSLKVFGCPRWEQAVEQDVNECTAPLLTAPELKILVPTIKSEDPRYPANLRFVDWESDTSAKNTGKKLLKMFLRLAADAAAEQLGEQLAATQL